LRDLDLLKDFEEIEVGFTITTNDVKIARFFESGAAFVADLHGLVDKVFIDRMNYLSQIKAFYRQLKLDWATEDDSLQEYKARLISELKKRRMKFEAVF
jgi:soluble P-type ATPase